MTATTYQHIVVNDQGMPLIERARFKIVFLIQEYMNRGQSIPAVREAYPHLTLSEIHSALAYYFDHQAELDEVMARREAETDELRAALPPLPEALRARMELVRQRLQAERAEE